MKSINRLLLMVFLAFAGCGGFNNSLSGGDTGSGDSSGDTGGGDSSGSTLDVYMEKLMKLLDIDSSDTTRGAYLGGSMTSHKIILSYENNTLKYSFDGRVSSSEKYEGLEYVDGGDDWATFEGKFNGVSITAKLTDINTYGTYHIIYIGTDPSYIGTFVWVWL